MEISPKGRDSDREAGVRSQKDSYFLVSCFGSVSSSHFPQPESAMQWDIIVVTEVQSFVVQKLVSVIRSHLFIFVFISITVEGGS